MRKWNINSNNNNNNQNKNGDNDNKPQASQNLFIYINVSRSLSLVELLLHVFEIISLNNISYYAQNIFHMTSAISVLSQPVLVHC